MATKYLQLRAVAALIAAGSLLPVACGGDDDTVGNDKPSTGGTGAKGGSSGKGGSSAKGGTSGASGDNGSGGTGNANGGTGNGGKGGKGGSSNVGGTGNESGNGSGGTGDEGGTSPGTGGTNNAGNGGEGNQPEPGGCTEADLTNDNPPCYASCDPKQTDDSLEFLNHCADGSQTLGGIEADGTPWTGALSALGDGCTRAGDDCVLPALP